MLVVTRDFGGGAPLVSRTEDPIESGETVMRMLMRYGDVKTRYGGRFVNAVNGLESKSAGDRRFDWFYYVNGIEADVGAAERKVQGSDRVWWDYHDWSGVMRIPAVVGSFPEPFMHGTEGKRFPVRIDCGQDDADACDEASTASTMPASHPARARSERPPARRCCGCVVGTWDEVRADAAARQVEEGPDESGVFARFDPAAAPDRYELDLLDWHGGTVRTLGAGAGLVAATRFEDQAPTWVVTGTDSAGRGPRRRLAARANPARTASRSRPTAAARSPCR